MSKQYGTFDLRQGDCMDLMRGADDNAWNLAIVDPPYFDGPQKEGFFEGKNNKYKTQRVGGGIASWAVPAQDYFDELVRVSKNQIIWGINYFGTVFQGGRIVWTKAKKPGVFSQCEIAYQSFYKRVDLFEFLWNGFWQEDMANKEKRIHPTQKPVALYKWLLQNYAKDGDKILDTHLGSGSIAIACYYMGFDLTGSELDPDYHAAMMKRIDKETRQQELF